MSELVTATKPRQKSRLNSYTAGAMLLAASGMIAKILGAIYRIPLTNLLGAEGIGMYQLVFPVYALMLTISSGGIPTAISRLVSENKTIGDGDKVAKIMKSAFVLLFGLGAVSMLIMFLISAPLATLQNNYSIRYAYYVVAPAILIVAISAYFKGWFQGNMNMLPTAISQIAEQAFKMIFGLLFAYLLLPQGVINAVVGALIGLTLAEFLSMLIMALLFIANKGKAIPKVSLDLENTKNIVKVSLPIMASGLIFPIVQFVDSLLIVNLLVGRGLARDVAVGQYGILSAPVNTLINMPIVITLAFAVAIVPIISSKRALRDAVSIKDKSALAVKMSFLIGAPCFVAILILAKPLMMILYPSLDSSSIELAASLLMVSSVSVILLTLSQVFTSLMQALGKTVKPVLILLMTAVTKIVLDIILIMHLGIMGAALSSVIAYFFCVLVGWVTMSKLLGNNEKLVKNISKIFIISVIIGFIIYGLTFLLSKWWLVLASVAITPIVYFILVLFFKVFTNDELYSFPFGEKLAKLDDKIHKKSEGL